MRNENDIDTAQIDLTSALDEAIKEAGKVLTYEEIAAELRFAAQELLGE